MGFATIDVSTTDSVASIRLMRPAQMNSINLQMVAEIGAALDQLEVEPDTRVLTIIGTGAAFCAGADLKEVLAGLHDAEPATKDFLDQVGELFRRIRFFPQPVIGALNGVTLAGGLELALCCDVLLAAESAQIGDAHSNFGVFPGAGGAAVLPQRIGLNNAKFLLFTGTSLPAQRLLEMGLVQELVSDEALEDRLSELAAQLAEKSPLVLRRMKSVANASIEMSQAGALQLELETLRNHLRSKDIEEGLTAFREKRKPVFTGQ